MNIIIAGIHTGIGKTLCSAIICQALGYDYWKPVQAGDLENMDSILISRLVTNKKTVIHPERYRLKLAASPHYAAQHEGILIRKEDFFLPKAHNSLLVETAGGIISPLSPDLLNIDLMEALHLPVVLIINPYLGAINHSLLSIEALKQRHIPVVGLVFCGENVQSTQEFILQHSHLPLLFKVPFFPKVDAATIALFAKTLQIHL